MDVEEDLIIDNEDTKTSSEEKPTETQPTVEEKTEQPAPAEVGEMKAPEFDPTKASDVAPIEKGESKMLPQEEYTTVEKKDNKVVKINLGRVFTIKTVSPTKPKLVDKDGKKIEPEEGGKGGRSYKVKVKTLFEEDNLVTHLPNARYWINDGQMSETPGIPRIDVSMIEEKEDDHFTPETAKVFAKLARHLGRETKEMSEKEFWTLLPGKKVTLKLSKGNYNNKDWFRNDIFDFVKE